HPVLRRQRGSRRARPAILLADPPQALRPRRPSGLNLPRSRARPYPASSPASAAIRGGRTTVTVQAASEATLAETLPSSVRRNERDRNDRARCDLGCDIRFRAGRHDTLVEPAAPGDAKRIALQPLRTRGELDLARMGEIERKL